MAATPDGGQAVAGPIEKATTRPATDRFVQWVLLIASIGLVLRVGWVLAERERPAHRRRLLHRLARALARGKGFIDPHTYSRTGGLVASANHTPAWPVTLMIPQVLGFSSVLPSQLFACLVGAGTVVTMGFTGGMIAGPRVGLIAAAISAVPR